MASSGELCKLKITTCEMQTGGTPLRIIEDGFPEISGGSLLQKLNVVREKYDHIRKFITYEPRGHHCVTVLKVQPDNPDADAAVIFLEKEGYLSMCGEATLSLGRYFVDKGLVKAQEPETLVKIQCPCGLVPVYVSYKNKQSGSARFQSVPSFVFAQDIEIFVDGFGAIKVDIAYGGAFYGVVSVQTLGIDLGDFKAVADAGHAINAAINKKVKLEIFNGQGLAYLGGTIVTDISEISTTSLVRQMPVFRDSEGRGPCGSGTSAHVALLYAKGRMKLNDAKNFQSSMSGSGFTAKVVETRQCGEIPAVTVEVSGKGFYTGKNVLTAEEDDPLGQGFIGI